MSLSKFGSVSLNKLINCFLFSHSTKPKRQTILS